MSQEFH